MCNEALIGWFPQNRGLAVGLGTLAFGLGIVSLTILFTAFLTVASVADTIVITGCLLALGMLPAVLFMRWPGESNIHYDLSNTLSPEGTVSNEETIPIRHKEHDYEQGGYIGLAKSRNFWLYIIVVFTSGASFCLNPYFYKIGLLFGVSFHALVFWCNFVMIVSTLSGLFGGVLMDNRHLHSAAGFWSSPSRNIMLVLMSMQPLVMLMMVVANNFSMFWVFVLVRTLLSIIVTLHVSAAILLARDIFGNEDGSRAFGIGAGLSLGGGDSASVVLMSKSLDIAANGVPKVPSDFNLFYLIAAVWSVVGVICTVMIKTRAQR